METGCNVDCNESVENYGFPLFQLKSLMGQSDQQIAIYNLPQTLCNLQCTIYNLQSEAHCLQSQSAAYSLQSTLTVQSAFHILPSAICNMQSKRLHVPIYHLPKKQSTMIARLHTMYNATSGVHFTVHHLQSTRRVHVAVHNLQAKI